MKKSLQASFLFLLIGTIASAQTTAIDFTANDCNSTPTSHTLFTELNAGKVVVVSLVHPCGSCISPTVSASVVVNGFAATNPGKVLFYLIDGNNNCASMNTWATTYGLSSVVKFSSSSVYNSSYYSPGMPTIMVFKGTNHSVSFRQDNGLNGTNLTAAITAALGASGIEEKNMDLRLSVFPNPAVDNLSVSYTLNKTSDVGFEIYNLLGAKILTIEPARQNSGKHETQIDFESISNGMYILKLNAGENSQLIRFNISR